MQYFVYILYSNSLDLYYIESSNNPVERLRKYLSKHKGYTSKAKDWKISYSEVYNSKSLALKREKQLKGWKNRNRIKYLIKKSINDQSIPT